MTYIAVSRAIRAAAQKAREVREPQTVSPNPHATTPAHVQVPTSQPRR